MARDERPTEDRHPLMFLAIGLGVPLLIIPNLGEMARATGSPTWGAITTLASVAYLGVMLNSCLGAQPDNRPE